MQNLVHYVQSVDCEMGMCSPNYEPLPSQKARATGRYKEVNGHIFVEIEEKIFFGLSTRKQWYSEDDFKFTEVRHFSCA